jgi:class 3 adenylate cyclase/DNA-binding NarL/FixJ family response regulator
MDTDEPVTSKITVFLADDNLIVREGVAALLRREPDLEVVGVAEDLDGLLRDAIALAPQVLVTDIRMPPKFQTEGIDAAKELRRHHPGTGIVVLSQYDEPEYAIALLSDGAASFGYLLKDRVAEGDQLARAIRTVASGGSALDPSIVNALVQPVGGTPGIGPHEDELLRLLAAGTPMKAIAVAQHTTPEAVADDVERLFRVLAEQAGAGVESALRRLRMLHQAIIDREEQGDRLARMLPGGIAEKLRREGRGAGESEELDVTVLMSDVRGYSAIAERVAPTALAGQLNGHRAAMNRAILAVGGTVMQYVGDAVMAVFGAPERCDGHESLSVRAAAAMHAAQRELNDEWVGRGLEPFHLGIGISTGRVAAAMLGSEEHLEYTLVGDAVNLAQRLQQFAAEGETVLSEPTWVGLGTEAPAGAEFIPPTTVKGRTQLVAAWRVSAAELVTGTVETTGGEG